MPNRLPRAISSDGAQLVILATVIVAVVAVLALFDPDPFAEGATVERSTALLLFLTAAMLVVADRADRWRRRWHLVAVTLLLAFRELDFDKAFLSEGILQLRLYTGDAPLAEKLAGAMVVTFVLWVGLRLVRRDLPAWFRGVRAGRPMPLLLLGAGLAVIVAKAFDGAERKLAPFGVTLPPEAPRLLVAAEESLELAFALALLVCVLLWWRDPAREGQRRCQP